jgi:hypothetical protein
VVFFRAVAFLVIRKAPLAQLAEQLTLNQWVPGSSPGGRTENPATSHEGWIFLFVTSGLENVGS